LHLAALSLHPVKSLRPLSVTSVEVDELGPVGDRRFLVVDPEGVFQSQRTLPAMARIGALLDGPQLILRADGHPDLAVSRASDPQAPLRPVRIFKTDGLQAEDCGAEPSAWLSAVLQTPCQLVRVGPRFHRPVPKSAAMPADLVAFSDSCPFLVISEASLGDLNLRLQTAGGPALPMERFRPNLVISGCAPYAEDSWIRFRIGEVTFRSAGPCARCIVTTTDQRTGERGIEPLRTLAAFRRDEREPSHVNFGQNAIHESKAGILRLGDAVVVLQ